MIQPFVEGLSKLEIKLLEGTAFRATQSRFLETPLSAIGSILTGGRYNPKGLFEVLYLAENADTTLKEVGFGSSSQGQFQASPIQPYLVLSAKFKLQRIVDISIPNSWASLHITRADLTASWRDVQAEGRTALTQQLAWHGCAVSRSRGTFSFICNRWSDKFSGVS